MQLCVSFEIPDFILVSLRKGYGAYVDFKVITDGYSIE